MTESIPFHRMRICLLGEIKFYISCQRCANKQMVMKIFKLLLMSKLFVQRRMKNFRRGNLTCTWHTQTHTRMHALTHTCTQVYSQQIKITFFLFIKINIIFPSSFSLSSFRPLSSCSFLLSRLLRLVLTNNYFSSHFSTNCSFFF